MGGLRGEQEAPPRAGVWQRALAGVPFAAQSEPVLVSGDSPSCGVCRSLRPSDHCARAKTVFSPIGVEAVGAGHI
jgi:hypothetical protein